MGFSSSTESIKSSCLFIFYLNESIFNSILPRSLIKKKLFVIIIASFFDNQLLYACTNELSLVSLSLDLGWTKLL